MENPVKKYELEQEGKKYTLSTQIFENKLRFVCIEVNQLNPLVYTGEFSLTDLQQLNEIFASIKTISEADEIFDNILVNQKVSLEPEGNILNLTLVVKKEDQSENNFILKLNLFNQNVSTNEQISSPPINDIQINTQQQSINPIISLNVNEVNDVNMNYSTNSSTNAMQNGYEHISQVSQTQPIETNNNMMLNTNITNSSSSSPYITEEKHIHIESHGSQPSGNIMLNSIENNSSTDANYANYQQMYQTPETQVQSTASDINTHINNYSENLAQEQYGYSGEQKAGDIMLNGNINQYNNQYNYENIETHTTKTKRKRVDKLTLSLRAVPKDDTSETFNEFIRSSLNQDTAKVITSPIVEQPVNIPQYTTPIVERTVQSTETTIQIDNLRNENNRLKDIINQLKSRIEILTQENQYLKLRNNELLNNMSNGSDKQEILLLREENERLRKEIEILRRQFSEFEEYKRTKEEEINYLKIQNEELVKNLRKIEEYGMQREKEIEELKLYIEELIRNKKIDELQYQNILRQHQNSAMNMEEKVLSIQDTRLEIVKGDIIQNTQELELLTRKISKRNRRIILNLLYKATIDSDKAEVFHEKCDDAESSLVLIKSGNGKRFGGYTSCNWKGNSIEKKDENAFVFSLDKMKIYDNIPGEDAIGCYPKYGPIFLGCQIRIFDEFFTNGGTTFEKGLNYKTEEDYELSGGLKKYDVKEIEVYSVEVQ